MMIRSATALRNDYDGMVKLSTEKQEPIYLTRNGDGEMVFLPIELWEKRQAELELFAEMLRREQNKIAGAKTYSASELRADVEDVLVRVEWLNEARNEFLAFLKFYKTEVGIPYAKKFAEKILHATEQLADFPELGVLKYDTLMGKHGFRALFIDQYVCIYKIEMDTVYIYHFADARKNYMYHIFGME